MCDLRRRIATDGPGVLIGFLLVVSIARAQESPVVARVGDRPIYQSEVRNELDRVLGGREVADHARNVLQAQTVVQLTDRQLVLAYLVERKIAVNDQEIDQHVDQISRHLARRRESLEDYLQKKDVDEAQFRRSLVWQLSWQRYLDKHLTDETLQTYFDQHRRDFDGTRLRVSQIQLQLEEEGLAEAVDRARTIAGEIADQRITFAKAAELHSTSPSGREGGDIGFIERHHPMPETFSRATFALDPGQVSEPVVTAFGVHLIVVTEVEAGDLAWQDVRQELQSAASEYLFRWTADRQRPAASIEFTGALPYFDPGSGELVLPSDE